MNMAIPMFKGISNMQKSIWYDINNAYHEEKNFIKNFLSLHTFRFQSHHSSVHIYILIHIHTYPYPYMPSSPSLLSHNPFSSVCLRCGWVTRNLLCHMKNDFYANASCYWDQCCYDMTWSRWIKKGRRKFFWIKSLRIDLHNRSHGKRNLVWIVMFLFNF